MRQKKHVNKHENQQEVRLKERTTRTVTPAMSVASTVSWHPYKRFCHIGMRLRYVFQVRNVFQSLLNGMVKIQLVIIVEAWSPWRGMLSRRTQAILMSAIRPSTRVLSAMSCRLRLLQGSQIYIQVTFPRSNTYYTKLGYHAHVPLHFVFVQLTKKNLYIFNF